MSTHPIWELTGHTTPPSVYVSNRSSKKESLLELIHGKTPPRPDLRINRSEIEEIAKLSQQLEMAMEQNSLLEDVNTNLKIALRNMEIAETDFEREQIWRNLREREAEILDAKEKTKYLEYTIGKHQQMTHEANGVSKRTLRILRDLSGMSGGEGEGSDEDEMSPDALDISGMVHDEIPPKVMPEQKPGKITREIGTQSVSWPWEEEMEDRAALSVTLEREIVAMKNLTDKLERELEINRGKLVFSEASRETERVRFESYKQEMEEAHARPTERESHTQTDSRLFSREADTQTVEMSVENISAVMAVLADSFSSTDPCSDLGWLRENLRRNIQTREAETQLAQDLSPPVSLPPSAAATAEARSTSPPKQAVSMDLSLSEIVKDENQLVSLIRNLSSDDVMAKLDAAATICKLASISPHTIPTLVRHNIVSAVLSCLSQREPKLFEASLAALTNLGMDVSVKEEFARQRGSRLILRALETKTRAIQYQACGALWSLTSGSEANKKVEPEILACLVDIVKIGDDALRAQAAGALGNLCANVKENKIIVGQYEGVEALTRALESSNELLVAQAAICLGNLSIGTKKNLGHLKKSASGVALANAATRVRSDSSVIQDINAAFLRVASKRQHQKLIEKGGLQRTTSAPLAGISSGPTPPLEKLPTAAGTRVTRAESMRRSPSPAAGVSSARNRSATISSRG